MKKIAVVCAPGIGDALILQIASHQLQRFGFEAITFSNHLSQFGNWLSGNFAPQPELEQIPQIFSSFDAIFLQHDNSPKARKIHSLDLPIYTFYGNHVLAKHGPLKLGFDFVCNQERTMVENVMDAVQTLFRLPEVSSENGLKAPAGLTHRRFQRRVAIHPTSAAEEKSWPREKFLELADWLDAQGYEPDFLVPPTERFRWGGPDLPNLNALASFIYESGFFIGNDSGPGHLASCLKIPHLIIGREKRQMQFWRPGWLAGEIAFPSPWIPNWKGMRLRESYWKRFITTNNIINRLKRNVLRN